eukprot:CAMPEP_0119346580 /NCGR_PEP_ID=MMETSP1333-20130426/108075_1 /TAXON_ID=418940 /ORGANISM="Scyphosphaera apsteinii, Strain RCC1455" /LENGTH=425 /DNA_ID=CAMNT_0007359083 /DNA_START=109 /DNA_END=1386 /DNA_ORIENTATION=+
MKLGLTKRKAPREPQPTSPSWRNERSMVPQPTSVERRPFNIFSLSKNKKQRGPAPAESKQVQSFAATTTISHEEVEACAESKAQEVATTTTISLEDVGALSAPKGSPRSASGKSFLSSLLRGLSVSGKPSSKTCLNSSKSFLSSSKSFLSSCKSFFTISNKSSGKEPRWPEAVVMETIMDTVNNSPDIDTGESGLIEMGPSEKSDGAQAIAEVSQILAQEESEEDLSMKLLRGQLDDAIAQNTPHWKRDELGAQPPLAPIAQLQVSAPAKGGLGSEMGEVCSRNRKYWSADEDAFILAQVAQMGQKWRVIAEGLPGRSDDAVRNRWKRLAADRPATAQPDADATDMPGMSACSEIHGSMGTNGGKPARQTWSPEEDAAIVHSVRYFGFKWVQMSEHFPGRTAQAIRNRFYRLQQLQTEQVAVEGI